MADITYLTGKGPHSLEKRLIFKNVDRRDWDTSIDTYLKDGGYQGVKKAILAAKFYGASTVLLVPGKVNKETTYQQAWQRSIPEIRKAALFAETRNIKLALENVWNDFLTTPEETLRYINEIDRPNVYAYFDIGNTVRYNEPSAWPKILGDSKRRWP